MISTEAMLLNNNTIIENRLIKACYEASLNVEQILYDLRMDSILEDYQMVLEDSTALTVYKEPSKYKVAFDNLVKKIVSALKAFKEQVFNLLDKFVITIKDMITSSMINNAAVRLAYKNNIKEFINLHNDNRALEKFFKDNCSVAFTNIPEGGIFDICDQDLFYVTDPLDFRKDDKIYSASDIYNFYVKPKDSGEWSERAAINLFLNGIKEGFDHDWSMYFIQYYKDKIDKELNANIRDLKRQDFQDKSEILEKYSLMMKNNMGVVHGYIRVWSRYVRECIKIIFAMSNEVNKLTVRYKDVKD